MKKRVPYYFDEFKCISSKCPDTCCAGWEIVIDDESFDKYSKVDGEFGDVLRSKISKDDGDNIFTLSGNDCPFLNKNKLCDIYSNLGEDALCYTCKQYPRFTEEFGNIKEVGLSLSCMEATRIMMKDDKKVTFELSDDDGNMPSYNDVNAMFYIEIINAREVIYSILQNRELDLNLRASLALNLCQEIQAKIDMNDFKGIKEILKTYYTQQYLEKITEYISSYSNNKEKKYSNIKKYIEIFENLQHINENDSLQLEKIKNLFTSEYKDIHSYVDNHMEFDKYYVDKYYKFEHLLVYFVFRYFMKSVFDYDLCAKIKLTVVSYIMIKEMCVSRWINNKKQLNDDDIIDVMHMYSKDIEHLEENIEKLSELFETDEAFTTQNLFIVLNN